MCSAAANVRAEHPTPALPAPPLSLPRSTRYIGGNSKTVLSVLVPVLLILYIAISLAGTVLFSVFFAATYPIYITYVRRVGGRGETPPWP